MKEKGSGLVALFSTPAKRPGKADGRRDFERGYRENRKSI